MIYVAFSRYWEPYCSWQQSGEQRDQRPPHPVYPVHVDKHAETHQVHTTRPHLAQFVRERPRYFSNERVNCSTLELLCAWYFSQSRHFHSFCAIDDNAKHLALVPYLAGVYSAGESDLDAGFFFLENRPEVGKLLWAQAPSLKMRPAKSAVLTLIWTNHTSQQTTSHL